MIGMLAAEDRLDGVSLVQARAVEIHFLTCGARKVRIDVVTADITFLGNGINAFAETFRIQSAACTLELLVSTAVTFTFNRVALVPASTIVDSIFVNLFRDEASVFRFTAVVTSSVDTIDLWAIAYFEAFVLLLVVAAVVFRITVNRLALVLLLAHTVMS
jgi:hypothetical protein